MPLATFKDLCIDANEPAVLADFWAAAIGLERHDRPDGAIRLAGSKPEQTVWINHVPEPKSAKHRVHLDVHGTSAEELEALGATVLDATSFRWTVMADPEGGEFCLFPRETPPAYRLYEIVVATADHESASAWWGELIGGTRVLDDRGFSWLEDIPSAPFEAMAFVPVPDPAAGKNRVHLDLVSGNVDDVIASGAAVVRRHDAEIEWDVLADPDGNQFCVFASGD